VVRIDQQPLWAAAAVFVISERQPTMARMIQYVFKRIYDICFNLAWKQTETTMTYSDYCRKASALLLLVLWRPERWVGNRSLLFGEYRNSGWSQPCKRGNK
jgi:hypothetical protein